MPVSRWSAKRATSSFLFFEGWFWFHNVLFFANVPQESRVVSVSARFPLPVLRFKGATLSLHPDAKCVRSPSSPSPRCRSTQSPTRRPSRTSVPTAPRRSPTPPTWLSTCAYTWASSRTTARTARTPSDSSHTCSSTPGCIMWPHWAHVFELLLWLQCLFFKTAPCWNEIEGHFSFLTFLLPTLAHAESTLATGHINVLTPDVKRLLPSCPTYRWEDRHWNVNGHLCCFRYRMCAAQQNVSGVCDFQGFQWRGNLPLAKWCL